MIEAEARCAGCDAPIDAEVAARAAEDGTDLPPLCDDCLLDARAVAESAAGDSADRAPRRTLLLTADGEVHRRSLGQLLSPRVAPELLACRKCKQRYALEDDSRSGGVRRCPECGGLLAPVKDDPLIGAIIGGFEIEALIERGGMGSVYRARQVSVGREIALKVLDRRLAEDEVYTERFRREARAAAGVSHANIVTVIDSGEVEGVYFIAMELVPGQSLDRLLEARGRLSEAAGLDVARQVAEALAHLEPQGLVHRDVKPANILLDAEVGRIKLTDFGLAKPTVGQSSTLTTAGMSIGTPHYMSPEQVRGEQEVTIATDVYSLGATLFELLTARPPFEGEGAAVIMAMHLREAPPTPPKGLRISKATTRLLHAMMTKNPAKRPTPAAVVARIQEIERSIGAPAAAAGALSAARPSGVRPSSSSARVRPLRASGAGGRASSSAGRANASSARGAAARASSSGVRAAARPPRRARRVAARPGGSAGSLAGLVAAAGMVVLGLGALLVLGKGGGPSPSEGDRSGASDASSSSPREGAPAPGDSVAADIARQREKDRREAEQRAEQARAERKRAAEAERAASAQAADAQQSAQPLIARGRALLLEAERDFSVSGANLQQTRAVLLQAIGALDRAIETWPQAREAFQLRARARVYMLDYEAALDDYDRAAAGPPPRPQALRERAEVHLARYVEELFHQGFVMAPEIEARTGPWLRAAATDLRAAIAAGGGVKDGYAEALLAFAERRLDDCIAACGRVVAADPANARAFKLRGDARHLSALDSSRRTELLRAALDDYESALSVRANHYEALVMRGYLRQLEGETAAALGDYDRVLLMRTDDPTGLWFRASWHLRRSSERQSSGGEPSDDTDLTAALRMIDRGLARRERSYILQMHRATTLGRLGRAREALEATERALQINPAHHFGWYTRGALEARLRRYDAAIVSLQRSVKIEPAFASSWYNLGVIHRVHNRNEQARRCLKRALDLGHPNADKIREMLAELGAD